MAGQAVAVGEGIVLERGRPWLRIAQVMWAVVVISDLMGFSLSLQPTYGLFLKPCHNPQTDNCPPGQASLADLRAFQAQGVSPTVYALYTLGVIVFVSLLYFISGFIIALRRRGDLMGLFVSVVLITFGSTGISDTLTNVPSGPALLGDMQSAIVFLSYPALATFMLTFPNGRFTPRWTAVIVLAWVAQFVLFVINAPIPVLFVSVVLTWGSCAVTQVYRYLKVYSPREKQQTKWLMYGLAIGISLSIVQSLIGIIWPETNTPGSLFHLTQIVWTAAFWAPIPVGVGIAIVRAQLYDIDLIIKRTVTYGLVTLILAGVYAGGVIGGQRALLAITGVQARNSPIFVVLSTLVVAALFQPLRRWIQTAVDRRFYRQAYDARQTLERFSAVLREEVDLPTLRGRLTEVVEETVQPSHLSLWLRETQSNQPR